jgi:hypothetical protein
VADQAALEDLADYGVVRRHNDPPVVLKVLWREAHRLAGLPKPDAVEALDDTISGLPERQLVPDPIGSAKRLISHCTNLRTTNAPIPTPPRWAVVAMAAMLAHLIHRIAAIR